MSGFANTQSLNFQGLVKAGPVDLFAATLPFVGLELFPLLPVQLMGGVLKGLTKGSIIKRESDAKAIRNPGGGFREDTDQLTDISYSCKERGHAATVDKQEVAQYVAAGLADPLPIRVRNKTRQLLAEHQSRVAQKTTGDLTNFDPTGARGVNLSTVWTDTANALPASNIVAAGKKLLDNCGVPKSMATLFLPDAQIRDLLCLNAEVRNGIGLKYNPGTNDSASITDDQLARALGVKEVIVAQAVSVDPATPAATPDTGFSSNHAMLFVRDSSQDLSAPQLGRTFAFTPHGGVFSTIPWDKNPMVYGQYLWQTVDEVVLNYDAGVIIQGLRQTV